MRDLPAINRARQDISTDRISAEWMFRQMAMKGACLVSVWFANCFGLKKKAPPMAYRISKSKHHTAEHCHFMPAESPPGELPEVSGGVSSSSAGSEACYSRAGGR